MSKREAISRYSLIIKKLRKHPATFAEIAEYLTSESELHSYNFTISKRTFLRDREDIYSLYSIDIQYDLSRKLYFINHDEKPEFNERILEAFDILNTLNLSEELSKYVHLEKRKSAGTEYLFDLIYAIKNRLQIRFSYHKFWEDKATQRVVEPYALKEFKYRWYLLAKDNKDKKVKSFALDRLANVEVTRKSFELPANYNIEESFQYCFGIINPDNAQLQEIVLSFDPIQGKYVKSLPLHESQEVFIDNQHELQIKLKLFVTYDLVKEILAYGEYVKVLSPDSLINEIKSILRSTLKQY